MADKAVASTICSVRTLCTQAKGCGDCYHGAFLFALLNEMPLRQASAFASAAAALNTRQLGGRAGLPNEIEIRNLDEKYERLNVRRNQVPDKFIGEQMSAQTKIRIFRASDAPAIAEIYNESVQSGTAITDQTLKSAEDIRKWMRSLDARESILVLEKNRSLLGWGIIKKYSDREGYRYTCETAVYIRHEQIGKGFGTSLKAALIEQCREFRYHHLVAKILADNVSSIEYNRKFGYTVVGRQREIAFMKGRWQDVIIMQLILEDIVLENPSLSS